MESKARTRKANFSADEVLFLAEKYEAYKHIIDAKQKDAGTNKMKKDAWNAILEEHQAIFFEGADRTIDELKVRLTKLKHDSRELQVKTASLIGGGIPQRSLSADETKPIESSGFKGLVGAGSSAVHHYVSSVDTSSNDEDGDQKEIAGIEEETTQATSAKPPLVCGLPVKKKIKTQSESFQELVAIKKENALLKRDVLLLKKEKLQLQIDHLKRKAGHSNVSES